MNFTELFRVKTGASVKLSKIDPNDTANQKEDSTVKAKIAEHVERLRELQFKLYAENKQSLLICLQALDSAGKDGIINHVLGAMNPQGTKVTGFKAPTKEEAAHDFLWRVHPHAPKVGEVAIFNRSHYEDVLIVRVHELVPKQIWSQRYDMINEFERTLAANGTRILKFFLHISEDEQLRRFHDRLEDPKRNWKISESDYEERKFWPQYLEAYEDCLQKTSTKHAPWFIIPSNNKWFRNMAVAKIVVETMEDMKMKIPAPSVDLGEIRRKYHAAAKSEKALRREIKRS